MNRELPDVHAGFRKGRGTRDQIANICWIIEDQESSRKTSTSALLTLPKPLTVWIMTNCGKFFKRWKYQTTWPASWDICMQAKKQQLELDMEQETGSKLGKESQAFSCVEERNSACLSSSSPKGSSPSPGSNLHPLLWWADSLPAEPHGTPKNIGVGSLSLLQGIFLTQESNWGLLFCRRILYQLSYKGSR